jgi:hypothetical protein|tara:strand:+ start:571 stop:1503 length:933 start_codon:yes stop_codon:yes gene_type:complete
MSEVLGAAEDNSPRQNRDRISQGTSLISISRGRGTKTNTPEHYEREDHLFEFMDEISKAIRGVRFVYKYAYERWVYMPGEPYPMGYIGFGDYRVNTTGDDRFIVCSRKIENVRYTDYSAPYHMKMSSKLEPAVRNAKKFLSNYSPIEMAGVDTANVRNGINEVLGDLSRKATEDAKNIGLPNVDVFGERVTLLNELRHLLNTDHEFVDARYNAKLRTMFESMKEFAACNERINMNFVRVYQRLGDQTFDVVPVDEVNNWGCEVRQEVTRYTDDLPEDIMGKVASLSLVADRSYVAGVGYRVNESMFYVVR